MPYIFTCLNIKQPSKSGSCLLFKYGQVLVVCWPANLQTFSDIIMMFVKAAYCLYKLTIG